MGNTYLTLCVCVCVCVCARSGLFCELSPPMVLPRTSPCDHYDCANGAQCVVKDTDPVCQCLHGYEGMQCEKLVSVNFINRESFLQIPSNLITEQANISLQVHHTYTDHSARVREIKLILHQLCIYTYVCVLYACSRLPQMKIMECYCIKEIMNTLRWSSTEVAWESVMTPDPTPHLPSTGTQTFILASFCNTFTALKMAYPITI